MTPERRELIAAALGYEADTLVEIDEGFDFEVVIADDSWAFRFPRRTMVETALEIEIVLLPALRDALPVEVPRFEHVSRTPLFVGYPLIVGEPLVDEDSGGIRAFLDALHGFDASGLPVERPDWATSYRAQCETFEREVAPLLTADDRNSHDSSSRRPRL